ncbi:hypothetical protein IW138_006455 [Coemansia sp. RSA 986]|nr:hypothetical protein IW138_006455 [Coemansia sp. RSA 986]
MKSEDRNSKRNYDYATRITRSETGVVGYEYIIEDDMDYEEFYAFVSSRMQEVRRLSGVSILSANFSFIDNDSNMRYYSVSDLGKIEKLIKDSDLDGVFGGSDNVPEDFMILLDTHRFRINSADIREVAPTKSYNKTLYYFFDYETVWDPVSYKLQPYSFALIKCDAEGKIIKEWFEMDDTNVMMDHLEVESIKERDSSKYLIGFNNSRFDNFLLLAPALKSSRKRIDKVLFANNTILSMEIFGFKVLDLCRILNMPLAKACKAFKCSQQKLSLDHSQVQSMFMSGKLEGYMKENYNKIREYNMMDVKTLSELYFKTRHEMKRLCEVNIEEHMTLAVHGIYWEQDVGQLFQSYFEPLVREKMKQDELKEREDDSYNPAVRELCKLLMNSLSGKLIQRDYDDVVEVITSKEQMNKFRQKCKEEIKILDIGKTYSLVAGELQNYANNMPTIYGALIYSYARSHMYDTILSKVDPSKLFGMDTDSAFITVGQYNELVDKYPGIFGDDFGQFKEEIFELVDRNNEDGPFGIFVAPKCYCFYGRNKKTGKERFVKARFKGINIDRDRIWGTSMDYNTLDARQVHDLYYGDKLGKIDVTFYRTCLKQDVTILHSNLTKTVMNKTEYLNIKQHFCLKVIKHNA